LASRPGIGIKARERDGIADTEYRRRREAYRSGLVAGCDRFYRAMIIQKHAFIEQASESAGLGGAMRL
jgi:hypothetical protein